MQLSSMQLIILENWLPFVAVQTKLIKYFISIIIKFIR